MPTTIDPNGPNAEYYAAAVELFTLEPERIEDAWLVPGDRVGGRLFAYLSESADDACGCPSMVKSGVGRGLPEEMYDVVDAIRADPLIPVVGPPERIYKEVASLFSAPEIRPEMLPAFGHYQQVADERQRRNPIDDGRLASLVAALKVARKKAGPA